jgi:hypothetical protein
MGDYLFDNALKREITRTADIQNEYLKKLIKNPDITRHYENSYQQYKKLRFLITRQWNSWYPSFFNSEGGCYAITTRDREPNPYLNSGVIVIDPGFGFLTSLRKHFHIEPQDIKKIIVSHFHPDHMAGLIEFATLSYESEYPCDVFLNPTSYTFFRDFQGKYLHIHEIKAGQIKRLYQYNYQPSSHSVKITESAFIKMFDTHHSEIGLRHNSLGFVIDFQLSFNRDTYQKFNQKIGILGDTDGNKQYMSEYLHNFSDVDILILHLGSIKSKKFQVGDAHLYLDGVEEILSRIIITPTLNNPKLVLLSEFGLELGTTRDIVKLLSPLLESKGFSLFLCHGPTLITGNNYFENEVNAYLIDKIWINLQQKIKTELLNKEIEEIICTLGLFSLVLAREDCFNLLDAKDENSQKKFKLILKQKTKKDLSQLFINIVSILNISDSREYFNQIKYIVKKLYPKCQELINNLPKKNHSSDNINHLYLNLCNHSLCQNVLLKKEEIGIFNLYREGELIYLEETIKINNVLKRIAELKIWQVWILAEVTLFALMEIKPPSQNPVAVSPYQTESKIILKELPDYLDTHKIPLHCANAGSSIVLFENAFLKNSVTSFSFIDENGNKIPLTLN